MFNRKSSYALNKKDPNAIVYMDANEAIEVSHDKQITVRYRFQSEFETYAEVLEQCRNM